MFWNSLALTVVNIWCVSASKVDPSSLGLDTVAQSAGFIDVPHGSLFYWLFEAHNDPDNAPLVIWFNGGPGCSSLSGMLAENGPATVQSDLTVKSNPYSWNINANILYLDQPVDTGLSVATQDVTTTVEAAEDVTAFIKEFYKQYPQYLHQELHLAGESYAGRYLPVFAEAIMAMEDRPKALTSVLLGDAIVDEYSYYGSGYDYLCSVEGGFPDLVDQGTCESMNNSVPACLSQVADCIDHNDDDGRCFDINQSPECPSAISGLTELQNNGVNVYNIDKPCEESRENLCYAIEDYVGDYFNQDNVKTTLGISSDFTYSVCNFIVNSDFYQQFDGFHLTQRNVTNLLESGVQVLVYNGDKDPLINWVGARNWTREFDWSGHADFAKAIDSPEPFLVDGKKAGEVSNSGNLTFLRVYDAGHMVPLDQPLNAFAMFNSWIKGNLSLT